MARVINHLVHCDAQFVRTWAHLTQLLLLLVVYSSSQKGLLPQTPKLVIDDCRFELRQFKRVHNGSSHLQKIKLFLLAGPLACDLTVMTKLNCRVVACE